ncbi:MAG TPA: di-heme oxidoredictase family protein [Terriglobia bacterium]|nr:di-heme oxidoredictase family protein [Terriglobia bacterium]
MRHFRGGLRLLLLGLTIAGYSLPRSDGPSATPQPPRDPSIPRAIPQAWDEGTIANLQLPLADPKVSPVEVSWDYYYRIPRRPIYKSYPVYAPASEPEGYLEWLKQQEPQVIWGIDDRGVTHAPPLRTEADWVRAGELVFEAPIAYDSDPWGSSLVGVDNVRDPAWYAAIQTPVSAGGVLPFARYVIRVKGRVELGQQSCAMCHTRVMPDGSVVNGAQGNFPVDRAAAWRLTELARDTGNQTQLLAQVRTFLRASFDAPWIKSSPSARLDGMSLAEVAGALRSIPPGVTDRGGSSLLHPVQTPDLIGLKERRFLDHTGLVRQRSIGDLMSYASLTQDMGSLARYGGFIPDGIGFGRLPDPTERSRYSDDQLYALALYIYSLTAPPNPNKFDALAARGQEIFEREGCARCHTPPLYTNNKLTLAQGFAPTSDEVKEFEILPVSLGSDPTLALDTRRGTGFYKVPSLKGVWYRGMFPHDGSCATLEDWFNPERLREDYVPTGFKGYGVQSRPVTGHLYGLSLSPKDRKALIAFLQTL